MDWTLGMKEERAALKQMAALLLSFAALAELAAGRAPLVRSFVLWILRRAEAVACSVVGVEGLQVTCVPLRPAGDSAFEAMRLARGFRHLAREMENEAASLAQLANGLEDRAQNAFMQSGPARFGACRMLLAANLLDALHQTASATTASFTACATAPPDTS